MLYRVEQYGADDGGGGVGTLAKTDAERITDLRKRCREGRRIMDAVGERRSTEEGRGRGRYAKTDKELSRSKDAVVCDADLCTVSTLTSVAIKTAR